MRGLALVLFIFCFTISGFAQKAKEHYVIHDPEPGISLEVYRQALDKKDLDPFRYLDTRRTIRIAGSKTTVELYSANELKTIYAKPVSPLTIKDPASAPKIEFILEPELKAIKEKLVTK
jgi:hypothetical protein